MQKLIARLSARLEDTLILSVLDQLCKGGIQGEGQLTPPPFIKLSKREYLHIKGAHN